MISYKEYKKLFQQDDDGSFINLIIPKSEYDEEELNLIGKSPRDFTLGEIVRIKKYSADMFELVDKNTIE